MISYFDIQKLKGFRFKPPYKEKILHNLFILSIFVIVKKWFIRIKDKSNKIYQIRELLFFPHLGFGPIGPLAIEVRSLHRLEVMSKERPLTESRIPEER